MVNFVRNKDVAHIQALVTRERTGSGVEWTLKFIGYQNFESMRNVVSYFSPETATYQEERSEFARHVRIGLIPFISQTPLIKNVIIDYGDIESENNQRRVNDPWNHWVFEIGIDTEFDGEEQRRSFELGGEIEASRVTKEWKIRIGSFGDYEYSYFELDDDTLSFYQYSTRISGLAVKSLSPHWSIGGRTSVSASTFNNIAIQYGISPAIEYNIFPYSEYTRHEFSFLYVIGPRYVSYNDTTIYNKKEQFVIEQQLKINYELVETWGGVEATIVGSTYLYDLSRNRLDIRGRFNVSIFRGLSLFFYGNYSLINDQIAIPKGGATTREELLRLQDLLTGYEYSLGFGLSFTFGSIYSNVVNPRF